MEMSKNPRNWRNQYKLIKKILKSSERRDEFQLTFTKSCPPPPPQQHFSGRVAEFVKELYLNRRDPGSIPTWRSAGLRDPTSLRCSP